MDALVHSTAISMDAAIQTCCAEPMGRGVDKARRASELNHRANGGAICIASDRLCDREPITCPVAKSAGGGHSSANGHTSSSSRPKPASRVSQRSRRSRVFWLNARRGSSQTASAAPSAAPRVLVAQSTFDDTRTGRNDCKDSMLNDSRLEPIVARPQARQPVQRGRRLAAVSRPSGK